MLSGMRGGMVDNVMMRFAEIIASFPDLLLLILISAAFRETWFGNLMDGTFRVVVNTNDADFPANLYPVYDYDGANAARAIVLSEAAGPDEFRVAVGFRF